MVIEEKIMKMPLPILRRICCSRPAAGAGWGVKVETQSWKVLCKYTYVGMFPKRKKKGSAAPWPRIVEGARKLMRCPASPRLVECCGGCGNCGWMKCVVVVNCDRGKGK